MPTRCCRRQSTILTPRSLDRGVWARYASGLSGWCSTARMLPIRVRVPFGGNIGAVEHHSESPEAYFAHTAGLKVVTPSTPGDAYALLQTAIDDPDPVIF